ncbi:MAG: hypothetical protein HS126_22960 [Anaerolineales bacterium]|nr:hypothetical protein [Anaerolineales bacterium]
MSQRFFSRTGGANQNEQWEARLQQLARRFPYPATPDVTSIVRAQLAEGSRPKLGLPPRRLAWAALLVLLILAGLLAVPQVRAALVEYLQIGAVRIFLVEPTQTPTPTPAAASLKERPLTPTPRPSPTPLPSLLDLAGATTLAQAQAQVDFPIRLPAYPANLGEPDWVFLQDFDGPLVVLVWAKPDQPNQVQFSLHMLGPGTFAGKGPPVTVQETTVNGQRAYWTEGPYLLQIRRNNRTENDVRRLIDGHVLVWTEAEITYRLETDLSLEEAVKIAESLAVPTAMLPLLETPQPTPTPLASVLDLAGETTLEEAEQRAGFPVRLPTFPADLGEPDRVFFQELGGPVVVLVWLDDIQPGRVRLSLHELGPGTFAEKGNPGEAQQTKVNGQQALWAEGPYVLQFRRGNRVDYDLRRLVEGRVLIWVEGDITYRLESDLSLQEAVRVAESLR